jgi:hypothetical protein
VGPDGTDEEPLASPDPDPDPPEAAEAESVWSMAELDLLLLSSISDMIPLTD